MKKLILFFIIILLITPTKKEHSIASPQGIPLSEYESITFYLNRNNIENYSLLEKVILLPENDFNDTEAIAMIERIGLIHPKLLERLIDQTIQVKLFNGKLTDHPSAAHLQGIKPRGYSENGPLWDDVPGIGGSKLVLAKIGNSNKGSGHGSMNLELHELAHTIDQYIYQTVRYSTDYHEIWSLESGTLFPGLNYFIDYPEEYFAEAFVYFYLSEETKTELQQKAPLTYNLLMRLEQNLVNPTVELTTYR